MDTREEAVKEIYDKYYGIIYANKRILDVQLPFNVIKELIAEAYDAGYEQGSGDGMGY